MERHAGHRRRHCADQLNAPVTNINGYQISTTNDVGKQVLVAGYGTTSVGSSNSATNWNDGNYGHYAYNTYDVLSSTFNRDIGTRTINGEQWSYDPSFTWAAPTCRTSTARAMPATTPWVCWPPVRRHLDQRRRPGCERRPDRRR
jgi:hypothetical protein